MGPTSAVAGYPNEIAAASAKDAAETPNENLDEALSMSKYLLPGLCLSIPFDLPAILGI